MANTLILLALAASALTGAGPRVCINDTARLEGDVRRILEAELGRLLPGVEILPVCGTEPLSTAKISVLPRNRGRPRVLGSAYRYERKVLPVIEVYVDAIRRAVAGRADPQTLGRALARVAAHEAVHYFEQRIRHDPDGLLRSSFAGIELASDDPSQFAWNRSRTD